MMILNTLNPRMHGGCHASASQVGAPAAAAAAAGLWPAPRPRRRGENMNETLTLEGFGTTAFEQQSAALQRLSSWAASELPRFLPPAERQWQPSDLLPDSTSSDYIQQVSELRGEAKGLPSDVLVVLAGLTVTAATVPNQLSQWCGTVILQDQSGADTQSWAVWRRSWAGICNRHRQLLLTYCYLSGCFDMQALDRSMQKTIGAGWSSGPQLPYQQLVISVLHARMMRVMHSNLASLASYHGAAGLARIATAVATDHGRHEVAMVAAVSELFELDPDRAVLAVTSVVRQGVTLPVTKMDDCWHVQGNAATAPRWRRIQDRGVTSGKCSSTSSNPVTAEAPLSQQQQEQAHAQTAAVDCGANDGMLQEESSQLYLDFMAVADALGLWTVNDMAAAVEQCCKVWKVSQVQTRCSDDSASSGAAAAEALRLLQQHPSMLRRLSELQLAGKLKVRSKDKLRSACFSWVFKREVMLD